MHVRKVARSTEAEAGRDEEETSALGQNDNLLLGNKTGAFSAYGLQGVTTYSMLERMWLRVGGRRAAMLVHPPSGFV